MQGVRDALGRELFVESASDTTSAAGSDVVLTLDRYLTFITERAIADAAARTHAKAVVAVMMDPQTGEVLAMASVPSFNPNDAAGAAEAGARDRAITDTVRARLDHEDVHDRGGARRRRRARPRTASTA